MIFSQNVWAFKINLMDSNLDLGQGKYSTTATILNDGENIIAIEASARVRSYSLEGEENFDQVAENLILIPSQIIIPPNGEQVLNIRWTGPKKITTEKEDHSRKNNIAKYINEFRLIGDSIDIIDGKIINYGVNFTITVKNTYLESNVLTSVLNKIKRFLKKFNCGCHGAIFDNSGNIITGPGGTGDLTSHNAVLKDNVLTVTK